MKHYEFDMVTTRGGDKGESSLYNGERRRKDDGIFHFLGDLDELSCAIGLARCINPDDSPFLLHIQEDLLRLGSMAATPVVDPLYKTLKPLTEKDILRIEKEEARLMKDTNIPARFILPGKCEKSARVDMARSICRRCERHIVGSVRDQQLFHLIPGQQYLNRLSDFLFVLARKIDQN